MRYALLRCMVSVQKQLDGSADSVSITELSVLAHFRYSPGLNAHAAFGRNPLKNAVSTRGNELALRRAHTLVHAMPIS
jgi:hypothetical protein